MIAEVTEEQIGIECREMWTWHSASIGRTMSVARWGHYGKPVLFFPTGGADFMDCERFLMVKSLAPLLNEGRIKLYAVDSVCRWSWTNPDVSPQRKSRMQALYDQYLVRELLPFIRYDCGGTSQKFVATGSSLGGYNALNAAAKHPEWFDLMIGMSGTYILDRRMGPYWDLDYYYNNPEQFLSNLGESTQLSELRRSFFLFALGSGPDESPEYPNRIAAVLRDRSIPHHVEVWDQGADHNWQTWRTMLPLFLDRLVG